VSCGVAVFGYASVVWLVAIFVLSLVLVFHPWCSFAVVFIGYVFVLLFCSMFRVVSSVCMVYVRGGWASVFCGHVVSVLLPYFLSSNEWSHLISEQSFG
jgi:hypothetical protein